MSKNSTEVNPVSRQETELEGSPGLISQGFPGTLYEERKLGNGLC